MKIQSVLRHLIVAVKTDGSAGNLKTEAAECHYLVFKPKRPGHCREDVAHCLIVGSSLASATELIDFILDAGFQEIAASDIERSIRETTSP